MIDILIWGFGLFILLLASFFDFKDREIPDFLSYSFIFLMFAFRILQGAILKDFSIFFTSLIWFGIFFILGYLLYRFRMWGGGDAKLLMGCGLYFSHLPNIFNPFIYPDLPITFLINLIFAGSIYTIIYSIIVVNKKNLFRKMSIGLKSKYFIEVLVISFLLFLLFIFSYNINVKIISLTFAIILPFSYILLLYAKIVESELMIKNIPISKLTEGDWLAEDINIKGKYICGKKEPEVTLKHINKLKRLGVKNVKVKYGFPFVPSFFISAVLSFTYGNILFLLINSLM